MTKQNQCGCLLFLLPQDLNMLQTRQKLKSDLIKSGCIHYSKWEVTDSAWKYWLPDPQQHLCHSIG